MSVESICEQLTLAGCKIAPATYYGTAPARVGGWLRDLAALDVVSHDAATVYWVACRT